MIDRGGGGIFKSSFSFSHHSNTPFKTRSFYADSQAQRCRELFEDGSLHLDVHSGLELRQYFFKFGTVYRFRILGLSLKLEKLP